ncbi:MAG TPA: alpha/beta hydrolase, partial [Reyranellaceae bacterium]|nr:alpha/beta hydrolase [Reyranellaceae bacterium]
MTPYDPLAAPASIPAPLAASHRSADRYGFLQAPGARLRVASWNAQGTGTAKGTVVLLTGRSEFIEKYSSEIVGEWLERGFAVEALDWRGQGLSDRSLDVRDKGHVDDFATYVADLKLYFESLGRLQGPVFCVAHSMGGHILLRYLAEGHGHPLDAAIMTAPMTALRREALLRAALLFLPSRPAVDCGYLYGGGPYEMLSKEFSINRLTHDERRFRFTQLWFAADPRLTLGGPTTGWARQAVRSMRAADAPGYLERIALPITIVSS